MAVAFSVGGAIAANATTTTLNLVCPAGLVTGDILLAYVLNKDNQVDTFPSSEIDGISAWTKFVESNNGTAQRVTTAWARVTNGTNASGNTVNVTKPTDNNLLFCGVISAWSGCVTSGTPINATAPTIDPAATTNDIVDYTSFDPAETDEWVVAIGVYNEDLTNPTSISGTNPTFAENFDLETGTGSDGSIFGYSGSSNGAATGARTQATTSTADAINIGVLFGLVVQPAPANPT